MFRRAVSGRLAVSPRRTAPLAYLAAAALFLPIAAARGQDDENEAPRINVPTNVSNRHEDKTYPSASASVGDAILPALDFAIRYPKEASGIYYEALVYFGLVDKLDDSFRRLLETKFYLFQADFLGMGINSGEGKSLAFLDYSKSIPVSRSEFGANVQLIGEDVGVGINAFLSPVVDSRTGRLAWGPRTDIYQNVENYLKYVGGPRLRVGTAFNYFPDRVSLSLTGVTAGRYFVEDRVQYAVSGNLGLRDQEFRKRSWDDRWTFGLLCQDLPYRYKQGNDVEFQRWRWQLGAEYTPKNAYDHGTVYSVNVRYRENPPDGELEYEILKEVLKDIPEAEWNSLLKGLDWAGKNRQTGSISRSTVEGDKEADTSEVEESLKPLDNILSSQVRDDPTRAKPASESSLTGNSDYGAMIARLIQARNEGRKRLRPHPEYQFRYTRLHQYETLGVPESGGAFDFFSFRVTVPVDIGF